VHGRWRLEIVAGACLLGTGVGCSLPPTTPSPVPATRTVTLTVRVLTRTTAVPIEGALVRHNATGGFYTDAAGQLPVQVAPGDDTTIEVASPGYETMSASGIVSGNERWTFYLAPLSP
jgi:hypothetical protein